MTAVNNYGTTLTKGGTPIGKIMVQDYPEITTGKAVTTHHGSGGVATHMPNGLITLGDMTVSIQLEEGTLASIHADMAAESVEPIVLTDNTDVLTIAEGYFLSVKPEPADANAPDTHKASLVIACSGALVIS